MFLRCSRRVKDGKVHEYWNLVENRRLADGRVAQRQVLYLGEINASQREAWRKTIEVQDEGTRRQVALFPAGSMPADEVDAIGVRLSELSLRRPRQWGACWMALQLWQQLELDGFWRSRLRASREGTPWLKVLKTLVAYRLIDPGSEWRLHREWFDASAMADLLDSDFALAEKNTLYRCLDRLVEHKDELFKYLKRRWGELFAAKFEVLLYDLTSTYFETDVERGPDDLRQFGYSRDKRGDCRQVVIALIVTPEGFPLSYEVMTGNTADSTTLSDFLDRIEQRYGRANRIWVMDRGIPTEDSLAKMRAIGASYLVGTPKGRLSKLEQSFLDQPWAQVRQGVQVKQLATEEDVYVLAQSDARIDKERGMRRKRLRRYVDRLQAIGAQSLTRDQLLMKLGAAKHEAGRAANLVTVTVPKSSAKTASLEFQLDRAKLRQVRLLPACVVQGVADQVHDASLQRGGRKHRAQRLGHALEPIGDGNQDVIDATGLEVVEDLHPELGALGALDPQPEDIARAVGQHAKRQVDGLVANDGVLADFDPQRVEEDHRVHRLEWARLPAGDLGHDGIGHRADELGGDFHPVALEQKALNLAHRHAARVHRDDLVVKAGEAALVLGDQQRLEAAVAVARHFDAQRAIVGQHGLAALAVAVVHSRIGLGVAALVAQVVAELGAQRALDQRLLERHRRGIHRLGTHRAAHELVNQFLRNRRQRRRSGRNGRVLHLRLAWHTCSWSSCYASHTKFLTGSRRREGRYLLRTNLDAQQPARLWTFYIQLTEVEQAFKELKSDLAVRPIFHRNEQRIEAHIFVAFLAYCLQVTLKANLRPLASGLTPREVLAKFKSIQMVDVHIPTTDAREITLSRYTQPEPEHRMLPQQLQLRLPAQPPPKITPAQVRHVAPAANVVKTFGL